MPSPSGRQYNGDQSMLTLSHDMRKDEQDMDYDAALDRLAGIAMGRNGVEG